jgi:hypothetical protein
VRNQPQLRFRRHRHPTKQKSQLTSCHNNQNRSF